MGYEWIAVFGAAAAGGRTAARVRNRALVDAYGRWGW